MTNSEIKIKALKKIGGTEWEKAGHHRVYFNRAAEKFAGIEICRSNVNFYSAKNFEIYYDVDTDEFASRADGVEETAVIAIEAIKAACDFDNLVAEDSTEDDVDEDVEESTESIIKAAIVKTLKANPELEKIDNPYTEIASNLTEDLEILFPEIENEDSTMWAVRVESAIDDVWATI
jgi:hypothetical protein